MKRAICDLEQISGKALFETLSEGMPLIVNNTVSFDKIASRLYANGEFRASGTMRDISEEEAAKVLILVDYVRCPKTSGQRAPVLKRFYWHVAKRIHAMACRNPRIASFAEFSALVESESRPWHLDGPNGFDWIYPNSISQEREHGLYVDYMRDVTDTTGACFWTDPFSPTPFSSKYVAPESVKLVRFPSSAGARSVAGLVEIASVWRRFGPVQETDRVELRDLIAETLNRLEQVHCGAVEEAAARFIVSHWPFPLWPLNVKEGPKRPQNGYFR